jgi:hypothetical protein
MNEFNAAYFIRNMFQKVGFIFLGLTQTDRVLVKILLDRKKILILFILLSSIGSKFANG